MNNKTLTVVAVVSLTLLTFSLSALTALKVFAAQSNQPATQVQAQPAAGVKTTTSTKWEYRVLRSQDPSSLEQGLNKLAEQGFELFEFEVVQHFVDYDSVVHRPEVVMVFKRAKP